MLGTLSGNAKNRRSLTAQRSDNNVIDPGFFDQGADDFWSTFVNAGYQ
jgi:hypothetical protein